MFLDTQGMPTLQPKGMTRGFVAVRELALITWLRYW